MKKKEISLIVILIVFGFIYQAVEKGKVRFVHDFSFYSHERRLKGNQFVEFPDKEKLFPAVKKIIIENPAGEVVISKSTDDQVRVMSFLRVYYSDKGDVDEIRKKIAVTAELRNGELKIASQHVSSFSLPAGQNSFSPVRPEKYCISYFESGRRYNYQGNRQRHPCLSGKWRSDHGKHSFRVEAAIKKLQCEH